MFGGLFQPMHLLVIVGIALPVFGPKKRPEHGKGLGESILGFKAAMKETTKESLGLGRPEVGEGESAVVAGPFRCWGWSVIWAARHNRFDALGGARLRM